MSETIYAITTGEYSDYTVRALFADQAAAEAFRDAVVAGAPDRAGDYSIAAFSFFPAAAQPEWVTEWRARWSDRLTAPDVPPIRTWSNSGVLDLDTISRPPTRPDVKVWTTATGMTQVEAVGATEEAVRKAVADRVAQLRAEALGL